MIDFDFSKVPPGALRGPDAVALSTPDGLRHGYLCGRYVVGAGLTGPSWSAAWPLGHRPP